MADEVPYRSRERLDLFVAASWVQMGRIRPDDVRACAREACSHARELYDAEEEAEQHDSSQRVNAALARNGATLLHPVDCGCSRHAVEAEQ